MFILHRKIYMVYQVHVKFTSAVPIRPKKMEMSKFCAEEKFIPRKVKEAIFIKKELKPTLNRDGGGELS